MKKCLACLLLFVLPSLASAQGDHRVIVIMTDGLRWQDVFKGLDSSILKQKKYHHGDSLNTFLSFYHPQQYEARAKLMPFFWNTIAKQGQIHGNRTLGSKVDVANPYWFSYPGYSELTTGQVDEEVNSNDYKPNPNTNFFEFLNQLPAYKGKVAAFGAWGAFDRILNEGRAGIPVTNAFDPYAALGQDSSAELLGEMVKDTHRAFGNSEVLDVFMHYQIMHYLKKFQPKALFLSYGDTDEFAHEGHYPFYLRAAHRFDKYVSDIWNFVQSHPDYKDKTTLLITTDHGRGDQIKSQWTSHGQKVLDSHETWFAMLGKGVPASGEAKGPEQVYNKELIHRLASLMGLRFQSQKK